MNRKLEIQKLINVQNKSNATLISCQNQNQNTNDNICNSELISLRKDYSVLNDNYSTILTENINFINQITNLSKEDLILSCLFEDGYENTCIAEDLQINDARRKINNHSNLKSNSKVIELNVRKSEMLYLHNNIFKTFPNLEIVSFTNISIKHLFVDDFDGASKLKRLSMDENQVQFLGDNIFEGAEQLESLTMNSNQIERVSPNAFKGLKMLKNLSLVGNLIKELHVDTFKELVNLENLILASNQLQSLDGSILEFNTNLFKLSLDENKLEEIGEFILNYSFNLKIVDFSRNTCINIKSTDTDLESLISELESKCLNYRKLYNHNDLVQVKNERMLKESDKYLRSIYLLPCFN